MEKNIYDVIVCGGGPAGIGAGITAAAEGMKTIVIEMQNCLGGVATAGMMSNWGGASSSKLLTEIDDRSYELGLKIGLDPDNDLKRRMAIYHDVQMIVLEQMAAERGLEILYNTVITGAVVENGRITGVNVSNKSGNYTISGKVVIDATGDGDVAASAGVPYTKGRESDGKMQPCTLMFKIGGVDYSRAVFPGSFETLVPTEKGELQALAKQKLPFPAGHVLLYRQPTPGTVCCNMTNVIDIDGTNAYDVTKALTVCRSQIPPIIEFLREYVPGYEKCWLMSSGSMLGVRETRHFEGVSALSADDIVTARVYDDWVVRRAWFNFDVHNMTGSGLDATGCQKHFNQPKAYTIPYGCLLPKKVENLLLSGRNISGSHMAHSNFRIMSVCIAIGEAAGAAASLYCKQNLTSLKDVNVREIQSIVGE